MRGKILNPLGCFWFILLIVVLVWAYIVWAQDLVIDKEDYGEINRVEIRILADSLKVSVFSDSTVQHIILKSEPRYMTVGAFGIAYFPSPDSLRKALIGVMPIDSLAAIYGLDRKSFGGTGTVGWIDLEE